MKFPYSKNLTPPAPVVDIKLSTMATDATIGPIEALVDTGADATVVPTEYLDRIKAPITIEMQARGKWGGSRRVNLFLVDVHIGQNVLPHVQVVGDEAGDEVILGRDVLNKLKLLLDGPAFVTHVSI
jgi:predicted aspartyl protease